MANLMYFNLKLIGLVPLVYKVMRIEIGIPFKYENGKCVI